MPEVAWVDAAASVARKKTSNFTTSIRLKRTLRLVSCGACQRQSSSRNCCCVICCAGTAIRASMDRVLPVGRLRGTGGVVGAPNARWQTRFIRSDINCSAQRECSSTAERVAFNHLIWVRFPALPPIKAHHSPRASGGTAYTLDLKSNARKGLRVRIPPSPRSASRKTGIRSRDPRYQIVARVPFAGRRWPRPQWRAWR